MATEDQELVVPLYQTLRSTVSAFDSILVVLLTQGNAFVIAVLSLPIIGRTAGVWGAAVMLFALLLALFLLLANLLYWRLLKRATEMAQRMEENELRDLPCAGITTELNKIPLSAAKGSFFLYVIFPSVLVLAAVLLGTSYMVAISTAWCVGYVLLCAVVVLGALAVYGLLLKQR
jgi:hypothetical protein